MRIVTLTTCLLTTLLSSSQTKQQTIDWINSKIPKYPIVYGNIMKESQKMKIFSDGSFEIVSMEFEVPINPFNPKVETTITIKGNFKNLSLSSVALAKRDGYIFIDFNCANNTDCLDVTVTGREGITNAKDGAYFGAFDTYENNIGERLKIAFKHLITLCGGKKEAF